MKRPCLRDIGQGFLDLVYPPICLYCSERIEEGQHLLCSGCVTLLELLAPQGRCSTCFCEFTQSAGPQCYTCVRQQPPFTAVAAVFGYLGPAATLVKRLKYGGQFHLAKSVAAFMVTQLNALSWPLPSVLVPVPVPRVRRFFRGYNQSKLIANELAAMLGIQVADLLMRPSGEFSQAGLSVEQRRELALSSYSLKHPEALSGESVLLIDDVMTTGTTLMRCGQVLAEAYPQELRALSFCRAQA